MSTNSIPILRATRQSSSSEYGERPHYTRANAPMRLFISVLVASLIAGYGLAGVPSNSGCDDGVELQIMTDRDLYSPGATMRVTLLVRNSGGTPLYLFRDVSQCSSQWGWLAITLRDQQNNEVESWPCFADDLHFGTHDLVETLSESRSGIFLKKGEIYGREQEYDLPKKKGTYRLTAELAPPGHFTDQQKAELEKAQVRILRRVCSAPSVTITLK